MISKNIRHFLIIIGTRPEAIKLAPLISAIQDDPDSSLTILSTGQHRELLDMTLADFSIQPDMDLGIMQADQSINDIVSKSISALDPILSEMAPDFVVVQGDTSSAMAGALAAANHGLDVVHVEAGYRTFTVDPFPEEMNRRLIGQLAQYHFCPTEDAKQNLRGEGITENVHVVGNTAVDAVLLMKDRIEDAGGPMTVLTDDCFSRIDFSNRVLFVTVHRRENLGMRLKQVCLALLEITKQFDDVSVVFAMHLNPKVQDTVRETLSAYDRIHLINALPYKQCVAMMMQSTLILTDSGGLQEEAPSLGLPVLVLREVTERAVGLDKGCSKLVGTDTNSIIIQCSASLNSISDGTFSALQNNPYGDGLSASRILSILSV